MRIFIIFFTIIILTSAKRERRHECFTCDGFCDCISPKISLCPSETNCYTLRSKNGDIEHMGCAISCDVVNKAGYERCEECVGDLCALPNLKLDIDSEKCLNRKYINNKRDIGGGATFNNHQGIGSGVNPGNNGIGSGVNLDNGGIGRGVNPNNMGIGSGAAPGNLGIGHGANPGQPGIGGGVMLDRPLGIGFGASSSQLNRHTSVERDIGDGAMPDFHTSIGSGVRPSRNNAQSLSISKILQILPLSLIIIFFNNN